MVGLLSGVKFKSVRNILRNVTISQLCRIRIHDRLTRLGTGQQPWPTYFCFAVLPFVEVEATDSRDSAAAEPPPLLCPFFGSRVPAISDLSSRSAGASTSSQSLP